MDQCSLFCGMIDLIAVKSSVVTERSVRVSVPRYATTVV